MAAAIGRISTQAGSLGSQVRGLQRDSSSLADELKRVDSQARAAADTLSRYRGQLAAGGTLTEKQLTDIGGLKEFIVARGGQTGQAFVNAFERELGGGPAAPRRPAAMAAGPGGAPLPDTGPRDLTPLERAQLAQTGKYSPEELDRARLLKPGTVLVPPASRRAPELQAPDEGEDPTIPEPTLPPPRPTGAPRAESDERAAGARRRQELERNNDALFRAEQRKRAQVLTERQLRAEWTETTRALRQQEHEIEGTEKAYRRLERLKQHKIRLSEREVFALETDLPERLQDLRAGMRPLRIERDVLEEEARRRRYDVVGGQLVDPDRGPFRRGLSAFLGGTGFGAGGVGGAAAGVATGMLTPMTAALAVAGMLIGKLADLGKEAYATEMRYMAMTLPMARASGLPAQAFMQQGIEDADRYRVFELPDVMQARLALMRGAGRAETSTSILPVASLTGQTASEETARIVALTRLAPRFNPYLSNELLRAFAGSALARPRMLMPGQRGLPFDAQLYPEFAQQTGRLAQQMTTPLTRVSIEGVAGELAAASRLSLPGIDMSSTGGLEVAANLVQQLNQLTGRSGDAFGDMQMMGVLRLRGTAAAERLRERGIDINTPIGMLRAISRAPQLATEGMPEVQQAMFESMRQFMPDDDTRAMALALGRGMDPEAAYQLTRPGVERIIGARRRGDLSDPAIAAAAADIAERPDTDQFYQWNVRRETQMLSAGLDLAEPVGRAITEGLNDIRGEVSRVLEAFLNAPTNAVAPVPAPLGYGGEAPMTPLMGALPP